MARKRYIEEQIISVLNEAMTGDWKLLTYAWSYCRIDLATTSLEVIHGSVLYEVPDQEGDEQRTGHHDEERPPGHSGCLPSLFHKDVPDRQSCIIRRFPENAAEVCWGGSRD